MSAEPAVENSVTWESVCRGVGVLPQQLTLHGHALWLRQVRHRNSMGDVPVLYIYADAGRDAARAVIRCDVQQQALTCTVHKPNHDTRRMVTVSSNRVSLLVLEGRLGTPTRAKVLRVCLDLLTPAMVLDLGR